MLRPLKIKFMTIIMLIVAVMLAGILGLVVYFTKTNTERDSIKTLQSMLRMARMPVPMSPMGAAMVSEEVPSAADSSWSPVFVVQRDGSGELFAFGGTDFDLSDKDFLTELTETADSADDTSGVMGEYHLRWVRGRTAFAETYIFADITDEEKMIHGLVRDCILIGAAAFILLFFLSLLLVDRILRPTAEAVRRQREFIADASHELKTPLTVIMTNAEMMTEDSFDEGSRREFADNILKMSGRMRGLIEGMLELARMDASAAAAEFAPTDLSELARENVMMFEPLFYESEKTLTSDIADGLTVSGQREKLSQVIGILLDNALKYSRSRSEVTVTLRPQGSHCLLSVTSRGDTLSKADCRNIFRRFYRIDKSRNDRSSFGLGLSIAQSIVSEHKGSIRADSRDGVNRFSVLLGRAGK
ncbi:Histidine kinase-, DNA gyrase B-, and HSP90-like ATPase [Ruminococcus sp. YE71]|uniref:sensor histidine kinase n=1 Tax=unclassified Ruminococcus TaxID=2608920 RepID=UPI0008834B95|nr:MULTISPECIES: HAMP domain-containing sensor histidine kinase [unclassified Ruminococcus]SDA19842.1 Histidine kinase-, DNA gyrase B-, and HSP90-like ATPase [Ruminococcus sp. YE78]SFW31460.1 Histidine kinase-, DNA gyrase B-, and HSP90-like ATPase [Ruminococcus sp. YE71]